MMSQLLYQERALVSKVELIPLDEEGGAELCKSCSLKGSVLLSV